MIPAKIKSLMEQKGINQVELAMAAGISKASVSCILSDKSTPKAETLYKIASALGCDIKDIAPEYSGAKKVEQSKNSPYQFSTQKIPLRKAAEIMHMSPKVLAEQMRSGKVDIGCTYQTEGGKASYYISPIKFYNFTGWRY